MYTYNQQNDCTVLRIFAHAIIADPINITSAYQKLHIMIEQGASASISDSCYGIDQETVIHVSSGALLNYYMYGTIAQEEKYNRTIRITIAENARVAVLNFVECAGIFSLECTALFSGTKAHFFVGSTTTVFSNGQYLQHIIQKHAHAHTISESRLYGIVESKGRLESNGLISIEKGADQSTAEHSSKCLTIGGGAKAFAKPMLEIVPKNVFVKHGAAVGPLDSGLLRALQYRGIMPYEAEKLLKRAFFAQIEPCLPTWVKKGL